MKPKSIVRALILGSTLLATTTAFAADAIWNVDADGNWADGANWDPTAAPGDTASTTSPDVATFGSIITAARAITVDANRNIAGINFADNSSAYTLSGGNLLLSNGGTIQTSASGSGHADIVASPIQIQGDGGSAFITAGSTTNARILAISGGITGVSTGTNVTNLTLNGSNSGNNNIQGGISDGTGGGTLAVVKDGPGEWNFSTANNSYSGGTTINAGTLTISTDGRLGNAAGGITFGGDAKLIIASNGVTLSASRTVTLNSGIAVMGDININANPVTFTVDGPITGNGGLQVGHYQLGTGVTNLDSTSNNFAGPIILGTSTNHTYSYSTFTLNVASLADDVGHGNIIFGRGNGAAANTATLAWSNTATGPLTLNNRRIELDTTVETSVIANNNSTAANTVTVNTDMLVSRAGDKTFGLSGTNTGTNTFNTAITDSVTPAAIIGLTKSGAGRWILTQENTYSGATTVSAGVLVLNQANALPGGLGVTGGTSNLTLAGGTLGLGAGDFTRALGTGPEQVQLTTGNSGFAAYGAPRTVTFNNDSNFELVWGDPAFNPGAFALNVGTGLSHPLTLTNGIDLNGATRTIQTTANTAIVSGVIRNSSATLSGLTKTNSGILSLTNANTYNGITTVSGGILKLDNANAIPGGIGASGGTSNVTINGGQIGLTEVSGDFNRPVGTGAAQARFTASGGFAAFGGTRNVQFSSSSINWSATNFIGANRTLVLGNTAADGTVNWQQAISMAGTTRTVQVNNGSADVDAIMSANIGGGSSGTGNGFNKTGTGTLAFTANGNSHWGPTTVSDGTLTVGNGGTSGILSVNSATISVAADATLAVNRSNEVSQGGGGGLGTAAAIISGDGNFAQIGTGTTTLSNSNTYTGTTTVSAGTLAITGATQATSAISINSGATLGLDIATPVTAANAAVTLNGTVLVTGTPASPSHTLLTASSITGTPVLATPIPGYQLQIVGGTELRLVEGSGTPYDTWSAGALFGDDANGDGVSNGLAFLLGAADPNANALGLLPEVDESGGGLVMSFSMRNAAARGTAVLNLQHSSDLGIADAWTTVAVPETSGGPTSGVTFNITPGDPLNTVTATIANTEAENGKLFSRLEGDNP